MVYFKSFAFFQTCFYLNFNNSSQLQSYYECFLQIEKENDMLKAKNEQMKEKLEACLREQQQLESEKVSSSVEQNIDNKLEKEGEDADEEPVDEKKQAALNKLSLQHIDEELSYVNKSMHLFIVEQQSVQKQTCVTKKILTSISPRFNRFSWYHILDISFLLIAFFRLAIYY